MITDDGIRIEQVCELINKLMKAATEAVDPSVPMGDELITLSFLVGAEAVLSIWPEASQRVLKNAAKKAFGMLDQAPDEETVFPKVPRYEH